MRACLILCMGLCAINLCASNDTIDYLARCWQRHAGVLQNQFLLLTYHENRNEFYHSPEPWQVLNYESRGMLWCGGEGLGQCDTIMRGGKQYISQKRWLRDELINQPYWSREPSIVTGAALFEQPVRAARYSPVPLLHGFITGKPLPLKDTGHEHAVYDMVIHNTAVRLFIRKSDYLLDSVITIENDEMWGDVVTVFHYDRYTPYKGLYYPGHVRVKKLQEVQDDIRLSATGLSQEMAPLANATAAPAEAERTDTTVVVERLAEHIYAINLYEADSRAVLVEFSDFLVVIDAPLGSKHGERVIREAGKIAPHKPVKYYAFGHHHPWYLGGVRPFIHKGTTILTTEGTIPYLRFVAGAPHTLMPDSLQMEPRPLLTQVIADSQEVITDGEFAMHIHHIGMRSAHTRDYLLFYFPSEKLLLQGDLAWMPQEGPVKKAGSRQAGLYNAIVARGMEVDMIVQSWPGGAAPGCKTIFSFEELERSLRIK